MAIPKWITPAGQLGIVPELEYYEFPLDAYDTSGGLLVFSRVSGRLPLGLQVVSPTEYTITTNGNITAYTGSYISQYSSGANAVVVLDDTVSGTSVTVRYVNEIEFDIFGNLTVDGANVSVKPTNIANPSPARIQGIPVSETSGEQNVTYNFTIRAQNAWTSNLADRTFNLTITNVVPPIITPKTFVNKNKVTLSENLSANIGDYITQSISGANAVLLTSAVNTNIITATYVSGSPTFTFGLGNVSIKNGNVSIGTTAYPVSSTVISSTTPQNLGIYLDGSDVSLQLETVAPLPGEVLTWTLKSGDLPPGLTLSTDGLLIGVLDPIPSIAPGTTPNWDNTSWNNIGWDFPETAIAKQFTFTIQVYDGVNYDQNTYSLEVYPRSGLTADNDELLVSVTTLGTGVPLTIDYGNKHNPIITTTQDDLVPVREGSYFAFEFEARDIDGDVVYFTVPALVTGSFDEQAFSNVSQSYPYITEYPINNKLFTGVFPSQLVTTFVDANISASSTDITAGEHLPGDTIKILTADNYWQFATVTSDVTVRVTGNNIVTSSAGQYLTQASSLANALISNVSTTTGTIDLTGEIITGIITTLYPTYDITFSGNITANVGQYITQASSGANARVLDTFRYITLTGANAATITANIGDYITQNGSTGNAMVVEQSINSPTIYIDYISGSFSNVGDIKLNGANVVNAVPATIVSTSNVISVIMVSNMFTNGSGNIQVNGSSTGVYPVSRLKDIQNITLTANVGDIITQVGHSGNATVTANVADAVTIPVRYNSGMFNNFGGNLKINGTDANVWITGNTQGSNAFAISTTVGQYITQASSGANAVVIANVVNGSVIPVQFLSNAFVVGSGNLAINASNINAYPGRVVANTDITATYIGANTFDFNSTLSTAVPLINGVSLYGNISTLISVGLSLGALSTEGTVGFDEAKFDQGALSLPQGLSLNPYSGWITGQLPSQTINQIDYEFEILAYKRDDPTYQDSQLYTLTVLGDLNNRIDWITATDLGVITTGKVSDLFVYAISALGKTLFYELAADSYQRLPQGLSLTLNGLISGRVSFELFGLDSSLTTIDGSATTFDNTYRFTVTARDINNTIAANRTFTLKVRQFDLIPYENIYLKALPTRAQRAAFEELINDRSIFPIDKIYRVEDPWFGLAKDIRSLFLAGLSPSTLAEYAQAVSTNHFTKRFLFAGVKTAQVLDENFNVKYEVVYLQLDSENDIEAATFANVDEVGPPNTIDLSENITTPYYDADGNAYTTAYPNSTQNMENKLISQIGYENKGALPDWMTSRQANGRQLGFNHAVVLAYTKPGESALIAYRLNERNFDFNSIDFTVDRYELDNIYTANFDVTANAFITSTETTFDRYPPLAGDRNYVATVNYALSTPYDQIHLHTVDEIKALGGLDGVKNFKDGDTIVFGLQEFRINQNTAPDYNDGWSDVLEQWDRDPWAQNTNVTDNDVLTPYDPTLVPPNLPPYDFSPGEKWDAAQYIPGFKENNLNPAIPNKRIGVWQVNISDENIVTLTFVQEVNYYDAVFVRNGFTYGGTNIYYDPVVKSGYNVANYSIIPQTIRTTYTTFDGNGTRFFDHRDIYNVPEQGDKYIKFTKTGVFT